MNTAVGTTSSATLTGLRVLLTRPAGEQSDNLSAMISDLGGTALMLPSLRIVPPKDTAAVAATLETAGGFDVVIFCSSNAVIGAHALLPTLHCVLRDKLLLAIGKTTQAYLARHRMESLSASDPSGGSEALLAHPSLQPAAILGKRVLIIRGQRGRELLRKKLRERGCARVTYAKVYRQEAEAASEALLHNILATSGADLAVVTSKEGVDQLVQMAGERYGKALRHLSVVALSERIANAVIKHQFKQPVFVALSSSNQGVIEAILRYNTAH